MPDTATEEKKLEAEVPTKEPVPTEDKPAEKAQEVDDAEKILQSESGDVAPAQAKAAPVAEAADDGWKRLQDEATRSGISPAQMVRYASAGFKAEQASAQQKATSEPQAKRAEPEVDDEELSPLTRREMRSQMADMEQRTAVAIAGARNDSKLDALLNTQPLTRDEVEARETVARKTYELMAGGANMESAFDEASRRHANYLSRVTKRNTKKKIEAQRALGEGGAGESVEVQPPEFKPDAENIRTGKTLDRAVAFVKELHRR